MRYIDLPMPAIPFTDQDQSYAHRLALEDGYYTDGEREE